MRGVRKSSGTYADVARRRMSAQPLDLQSPGDSAYILLLDLCESKT